MDSDLKDFWQSWFIGLAVFLGFCVLGAFMLDELSLGLIKSYFQGNGTDYGSYKEALAVNDYEAAHKIIDLAEYEKGKCDGAADAQGFANRFGFKPSEFDETKSEILQSELTYLVAQNIEDVNDRIIFLINENHDFLHRIDYRDVSENDKVCNLVATLAANRGNEELIRKIAQQFDNPRLILENSTVLKFGKGKEFYFDMIYDILKEGVDVSRPQIGRVKVDDYVKKEYDSYIESISSYNKLCINAMQEAIDAGKMNSAKQLSRLVKKNIKYENLGDWCKVVEKTKNSSKYDAYKVTEDDSDIKEANRILKSALK